MWYTNMTAAEIEPDFVVCGVKETLCVDSIVRQDKDVFILNCHVMFFPHCKRQLALSALQLVSVAFGGNASETETIQ